MKVLVVEDDQDQLALRSMLFERCGFEAVQASNGASAMQLAAQTQPACAVVDLRLPTEDAGLQLIRDLKQFDGSIRLIVLTGSDPSYLRRRPEVSLIDAVFVKPASTAEIVRRLRAILPDHRD